MEGEVVESYSPKAALLVIKGKRLIARTPGLLPTGRTVALRVEETEPVPVLRWVGLKPGEPLTVNLPLLLSAIDKNIWQSAYAWARQTPLQGNLESLLQGVLRGWGGKFYGTGTESFKEMIDRSGCHWEAKLRQWALQKGSGDDLYQLAAGDLKGETIRFMSQGEGDNPLLRSLVHVIEEVQVFNLGMLENGKIFRPIPLEFPDGAATVAQLLIHLPRHRENPSKKDEKTATRLTLLLNLSGLGWLRIQLAIMGKSIDGVCMTSSEETRAYLEKNLSCLLKGIGERGFSVRSFPCLLREAREVERSLLIADDHERTHSFDRVV